MKSEGMRHSCGAVVKHNAIGASGRRFDSQVAQIGHVVASGPTAHHSRDVSWHLCCPGLSREDGPRHSSDA